MSDYHEPGPDAFTDLDTDACGWSPPADMPSEPSCRDKRESGAPSVLDLSALSEWLPRLGAVLWLDRRAPHGGARVSKRTRGVVLLEHPALVALTRCASATAHTQVTPHGPREWLSFRDDAGEEQAKLFLLPDTDYLAWDEMIAAIALVPAVEAPARWHAHAAFLRQAIARLGVRWRASLLGFETRRWPWLRTLGARPPLRISLLGLELAQAIALTEGAELVRPFHSGSWRSPRGE